MSFPEVVDVIPKFPELSPNAIPDILNSYVVPAIQALEVKVGSDSSTDANSLDYKVAHGGGGGGGGGSTAVPAGALAYGDGLSPLGVTGDAAGILFDDTNGALTFPQYWSLSFEDTIGGFGGLVGDGDELTFVTTDTSSSPIFAAQIDMNNDTPAWTFKIPVVISGSNGAITFNDQDGRDPYYSIQVQSGGMNIFSQQANAVVASFGYDASLAVSTVTALDGLTLTLSASGYTIQTDSPVLESKTDGGTDLGALGGHRFNNLYLAGNIEVDGGVVTGLIDQIQRFIEIPTAKTYYIILSNMVPLDISEIIIQTVSGSCTASLQINGTPVTGLDAIAVTATPQSLSASGANAMSLGDVLTLVISSPLTPTDLAFTIETVRS